MSQVSDQALDGPRKQVFRRPGGPATCSMLHTEPDVLIFGPSCAGSGPSGSDVGLGLWLAYWASDLVRAATGLWSDSSLILARALALPVHWGAGAAGRGAGDEVAAVELAFGGVAQELLVQSSKERSPPIEANPPEEQEQP